MNARSTRSGTTSVLIEPWMKRFRSSRDQVGTCSTSTLLDVDLVSGDLSAAVQGKFVIFVTNTSRSRSALATWLTV